jgi:hypothetical protein
MIATDYFGRGRGKLCILVLEGWQNLGKNNMDEGLIPQASHPGSAYDSMSFW